MKIHRCTSVRVPEAGDSAGKSLTELTIQKMRKLINWIFWISLISLSLKLIFIIGYWANIEKFLPPNGKPEMRDNIYSLERVETGKFIIADSNYVDEWGFSLEHSNYNDGWEFVRSKWLWLHEIGLFTLILLPLFFIRKQFNKIERELYLSDLILFRPINISFIHLGVRRIFSLISNIPLLVIIGAPIFIPVVWLSSLLTNNRYFHGSIIEEVFGISEICLATIAVSLGVYVFLYLLMTIICWLVGGFKSEITSN